MPLEIEVKFRIDDAEAMRRRLVEAGARPAGRVLERNTYFDLPGGELRKSDRGVRIRVNEAADGETWTVMTSKGPRRPGELKIRPEAEVGVESFAAAAAVLESLGYGRTLSFQKRRETFLYADAEIVLDELPQLGFYLEIEADSEEAVQRTRAALGLAGAPAVTASYIALVDSHLTATGDASRQLVF